MQTIRNVKALRKQRRANQSAFWSRIGVTQSGGSRYENGREMPKPTQTVVHLAYAKTHDAALRLLAKLRGVTVDELTGRK